MTEFEGELIAGGTFTMAGGVPVNRIAAWNGSSWRALGNGIEAPPGWTPFLTALYVHQGQLVAGGVRYDSQLVQQNIVTVWDGAAWHDLGAPGYYLLALSEYQGQLIAGGDFTGSTNEGVSIWDGSAWQPPAMTVPNEIQCLAPYQGRMMAGGTIGTVVAWDGAAWSTVGTTTAIYRGTVDSLAVWGTRLVAGGDFYAHVANGSGYGQNIAVFDGVVWQSPGYAPGRVRALTEFNGKLVAAGEFAAIGSVSLSRIGSWDGNVWRPLQSGLNNTALALCATGNRLFVSGFFSTAGGLSQPGLAQWIESSADFNGDGDSGTDADIEAFFACLAGDCCLRCGSADFNGDGDSGTDADIEAFFRVLAGGSC
jgi:hypothetical protein